MRKDRRDWALPKGGHNPPPKRPRPPKPPKGQCPQPSVEGEPSYVEFEKSAIPPPKPSQEEVLCGKPPTPRLFGIVPPPVQVIKEGRIEPLRMRFDPDHWEWEVDDKYERMRTKFYIALWAAIVAWVVALVSLAMLLTGR